MPGIEDLFNGRLVQLNDCSPQERSNNVARHMDKMISEEQEFIANLNAEKMQDLYAQMFVGSDQERTFAMYRWARGIYCNPRIPVSLSGPVSRHEAFDVLRGIAQSDSDQIIVSSAINAIGTAFQYSADAEITSYLAQLICDETRGHWLRIAAYRSLWLVAEDKLRLPLSPGSPSRHLAEAEETEARRFLSDLDRHNLEREHFIGTRSKEFNLETDIRWDWVKSFLEETR